MRHRPSTRTGQSRLRDTVMRCAGLTLSLATLLLAGACLSGRPSRFPAAPFNATVDSTNRAIDVYDTDGDGQGDYSEVRAANGQVRWLRFAGAGATREVSFPPSATTATDPVPQLVLILDSVPFELVRAAYADGRFRLFHPPSRIISPFPVMTDMCLNELFGTSPSPGVETEYYDGVRTTNGWRLYDQHANSPWLGSVDWYLPYARHNQVYTAPRTGFSAELSRIERALTDAPGGRLVAYSVATSALGFIESTQGHEWAICELDRFCHMLVHRMHGRIDITLLSDHGHNLRASRSAALRRCVRDLGYRVTRELKHDDDVVVLDFGLINCAALHTRQPAQVAASLARDERVELALYRGDADAVIVVSRDGAARIERCDGGWCYTIEHGDPLQLTATIAVLRETGQVAADGCIDDTALFAATVEHIYPDPLDRCWRAFHGLMEHTPDVLLSLSEGWHWGSPFLERSVRVAATHGNLNTPSSTGFAMTTAGALPDTLRMRDLAEALANVGVNLRDRLHATQQAD